MTNFISIRRKGLHGDDTSSLAIADNTAPGYVRIVGGLEHCSQIAPKTEQDRLALIAWLESDECKKQVGN